MFLKIIIILTFINMLNAADTPVGNITVVNVKEIFQTNCKNELKAYIENIEKELNTTNVTEQKFNISSVECLMFCGYKRVGVLDTDGNVVMSYLKNLVSPAEATFEPAISKCAMTERTANVCEKALKNIKCIFAEGLEIIKKTQTGSHIQKLN